MHSFSVDCFAVRDVFGSSGDGARVQYGPYEVRYVDPAGESFVGECQFNVS